MLNGLQLIRPRWRKVLADLWDNKLRTILVVAFINPANIEIVTDPFDDGLVESIKDLPGVKEAKGQHFLFPNPKLTIQSL